MSILFKNAGILTVKDNSPFYIKNAYLGVDGAFIDYIGKEKPLKEYSQTIDMYDRILIPGLVNCHTHSAMNLFRGVGSDLPLMDWLHKIWPIEDCMRPCDFVNGMNMTILEMLSSGTTSFCDMYMMPSVTQKCIEESGIKANITRVMMGGSPDTDYRTYKNRVEAIDFVKQFDGAFNGRLHADWSVHAEYTIDGSLAKKWADEITSLGGRLHIHLSETKKEHEECIARHGQTPAQWFESNGFFDIPCYAAHCVWVTNEDIEILRKHSVSPVHNPTSNMKLASGFAPVPVMLEKGLNVTLGTDGAASNNNVNMFEEMHIASVIHNGFLHNPVVMKPSDVFRMATVNGAYAQGRPDTGVLDVGKKADIVAINLDAPHIQPVTDVLCSLVYTIQASDTVMTMVDGKILYKDGEYTTMDREKIFEEYRKSADYLGITHESQRL